MNIPATTLRHHLKYLDRQKLVSVASEKGYKRYYITNRLSKQEKQILTIFRQEVPRKIFLYLFWMPVCSKIELSRMLEKNPSTIAYHLKKLEDMDLIEVLPVKNGFVHLWDSSILIKRSSNSNEIIYGFKNGEISLAIYKMFIIYEHSLSDRKLINAILASMRQFIEMHGKHNPRKVLSWDEALDVIIDNTYEIFPHPYHV
jgi:DNA-binding transcriptional ArsR family regulator